MKNPDFLLKNPDFITKHRTIASNTLALTAYLESHPLVKAVHSTPTPVSFAVGPFSARVVQLQLQVDTMRRLMATALMDGDALPTAARDVSGAGNQSSAASEKLRVALSAKEAELATATSLEGEYACHPQYNVISRDSSALVTHQSEPVAHLRDRLWVVAEVEEGVVPVSKTDELCIKNEELCIKNEEFCI